MKQFSPKQHLAIFLIIVSLFGFYLWRRWSEGVLGAGKTFLVPEGKVCMEVLGEVKNEGIYSFGEEVTVKEAVARAGGTTGKMVLAEDISSQKVKNGSKLIVSRAEKGLATIRIDRMEPEKLLIYSIPIELNEATEDELVALPGIGEKLAIRIVEYREANKRFSRLEELMEVKGIGREKYERLKGLIYLR